MKILLLIHIIFLANHVSAQQRALKSVEINELVPSKIKGFQLTGESVSRQVRLGDIVYTVCERKFISRKQEIKILLFDYKESPIMYTQATRKWQELNTIDSDTLIVRAVAMTNCIGWESYNIQRQKSQISIGVCDRFFLLIEGSGVDLEFLKSVLLTFPFEKYPR